MIELDQLDLDLKYTILNKKKRNIIRKCGQING